MLALDVSDIEGRHQVRVVIDGAVNSPRTLGVIALDRTPPAAAGAEVAPDVDGAGTAEVRWTQGDAGLSGTDPAVPLLVEYNTSARGDETGVWTPVSGQPLTGGDGPRTARMVTGLLAEGAYRLRVRSQDRAGNAGARPLGQLLVDRRAPEVSALRVLRAPTAADRTALVAFTAGDGPSGSGLAPGEPLAVTGPGGAPVYWRGPAADGEAQALVPLPSAGTHVLVAQAVDRVGRVGTSGAIVVTVPAGPGAATPAAARPGAPRLPAPRVTPGRVPRGTAAVYAALRRFHQRRGVRLDARLTAAATALRWRDLLGVDDAASYDGYADFDGAVLLGPATVRGLEDLWTARARGTAPAPAAADRMTRALAVALHETLHATGPAARADIATAPGHALEEGLTEAATADLLPSLARHIGGPAPVTRALVRAARRYRPVYRPQVTWVRTLSQSASRTPAAWRVRAADTWGDTRWEVLAAATGRSVAELRAAAPALPAGVAHR